jgi:hypothetical protein
MSTALIFKSSDIVAITPESFLVSIGCRLREVLFSEINSDHPSMRCEKTARIVNQFML